MYLCTIQPCIALMSLSQSQSQRQRQHRNYIIEQMH